jgi:hypothetical protein
MGSEWGRWGSVGGMGIDLGYFISLCVMLFIYLFIFYYYLFLFNGLRWFQRVAFFFFKCFIAFFFIF